MGLRFQVMVSLDHANFIIDGNKLMLNQNPKSVLKPTLRLTLV